MWWCFIVDCMSWQISNVHTSALIEHQSFNKGVKFLHWQLLECFFFVRFLLLLGVVSSFIWCACFVGYNRATDRELRAFCRFRLLLKVVCVCCVCVSVRDNLCVLVILGELAGGKRDQTKGGWTICWLCCRDKCKFLHHHLLSRSNTHVLSLNFLYVLYFLLIFCDDAFWLHLTFVQAIHRKLTKKAVQMILLLLLSLSLLFLL